MDVVSYAFDTIGVDVLGRAASMAADTDGGTGPDRTAVSEKGSVEKQFGDRSGLVTETGVFVGSDAADKFKVMPGSNAPGRSLTFVTGPFITPNTRGAG